MPRINVNTDRLRGCKIKIYPSEDQKIIINRIINIYRAVYNIGLSIEQKSYESGNGYISYYDMCKIFSDMRNNDPEYGWLNGASMGTIRQALVNLDHAFKYFFNKIFRYPKYKSKKTANKIFSVRSERVYIRDRYIGIPDLGNVYAKSHRIPIGQRVYNASVIFDGYDSYWFTCQYEKDITELECEKTDVVGIDVGIRNMMVTSGGDVYKYSDTSKLEKRLKRQQRRLQKSYNYYISESMRTKTKYEDIPKSKNMVKKLAARFKTFQKIKNRRMNDIHTATKRIMDSNPSMIVIEDIRTGKIIRENPWMRKYAKDMCFGLIHNILKYKAADRDIPIVVAKHKFPSSQICSNCGNIHKPCHSIYKCKVCGMKMDRDLNAAINLRNLGYQNANSSEGIAYII